MSASIVIIPMVVASWPVVSTAAVGVAAAMGFSVVSGVQAASSERRRSRVETALPESEVLAESMSVGESLTMTAANGVEVSIRRDERGRCTVCVDGKEQTESELAAIGDEVAGRLTQQFAYHKLMSSLDAGGMEVIDQDVTGDDAIRVRVRIPD